MASAVAVRSCRSEASPLAEVSTTTTTSPFTFGSVLQSTSGT
jgi:hypothetical protein